MSMAKAIFRNFLCANPVEPREENGVLCCEHCEDEPCVYVVRSEPCAWFTRINDEYPNQEVIKGTGFLYLLKECFTGCKWQAKWKEGECSDRADPLCWFPVPMPADGSYPGGGGCCWWGGGTVFYDACDPDLQDNFHVMWELEVTSPATATLTCTPDTGGEAVYDCSDWTCTEGGKFSLTTYTTNLEALPRCLDIVHENTENEPPLVCDTETSQCDCCDPGRETAPFGLVVEGCEGIPACQTVIANRITGPGGLDPGMTYPSPAPCGVWKMFAGAGPGCVVDEVSWDGTIAILIWCNGTDYEGEVYCFDTDLGVWVSQGMLNISSFECLCGCRTIEAGGCDLTVCDQFLIFFTLPELDCCCPEEPVPPCGECLDLPNTVTATCGSDSATLTWNGSAWVGTANPFCGVPNATITLTSFEMDTSCIFDLLITGDCMPVSQAGNTSPTSCDPLLINFASGYQDCDGIDKTITITE